jgi:hypothetical protein
MEDAQNDNGPNVPNTDDNITGMEGGFEEVLLELVSSSDRPEDIDMTASLPTDEGFEERISSTAAQAGEIITELAK